MEVAYFDDKLNKVDGKVYVIEEEISMPESGVYEAFLEHDNLNETTLTVYTGPKLTGEKIQTYALTTPSLTPWKRRIRIQTDRPVVYVCYETDGDTVEAEDVNRLQEEVIRTQQAVNEEELRALEAEQGLAETAEAESSRAQTAEAALGREIRAETARAGQAENSLYEGLGRETERAEQAESALAEEIAEEVRRATEREASLECADMGGATAETAGTGGLVPAPPAGAQENFLCGDGTWRKPADAEYVHPESGVQAGIYHRVTVNVKGHVTAGSNTGFIWDELKGDP